MTSNSHVEGGDSLNLVCHYTETDLSHLNIMWKFQSKEQLINQSLWTYDGPTAKDSTINSPSRIESVPTTIQTKHSIRILNVTEADSGTYSCHVVNIYGRQSSDDVASVDVIIAVRGVVL